MVVQTILGLDLFAIWVEYVWGSIALSLLGWALILLITGIMGRMSMSSILVILITFGAVASVGYVGALAGVPLFMIAFWYMTTGIINYINTMR